MLQNRGVRLPMRAWALEILESMLPICEVLDGIEATTASDVFSLGLIVYRMLSGVLPRWPFDWPRFCCRC